MFESNRQRKDWNELADAIEQAEEAPQCYNFPDAYFPDKGTSGNAAEFLWAKKMCGECPVRQQCAEYAIKWEADGIWGGMSATERRLIRQERGITLDVA